MNYLHMPLIKLYPVGRSLCAS